MILRPSGVITAHFPRHWMQSTSDLSPGMACTSSSFDIGTIPDEIAAGQRRRCYG